MPEHVRVSRHDCLCACMCCSAICYIGHVGLCTAGCVVTRIAGWTSMCTCRTAREIKKRLEGEFEVVGDCGWHTEDKNVKRHGGTGGEVGMWSERGRERRSQGDQK